MVTKQGNVEFLPDEWKAKAHELAHKLMSSEEREQQILSLLDRCCTEAVIGFISNLANPIETIDEAIKNTADPDFDSLQNATSAMKK